jgi:WhiB family redox-sensing transcriptional regulator
MNAATVSWLMVPEAPYLPDFEQIWVRPAWMAQGACHGTGTDAFFPERGEHVTSARSMCRGCPVRQECLEHALDGPELAGVWGGTNEKERARLRRAAS